LVIGVFLTGSAGQLEEKLKVTEARLQSVQDRIIGIRNQMGEVRLEKAEAAIAYAVSFTDCKD
jgi:hypothetical protein